MTTNAREKIIQAGAQLMHQRGYHHTGIKDILQAAGVPKGSFYFYFKSKEDFALELVDFFEQFWMAQAEQILGDETQPPLTRLYNFFLFFRDYFQSQGCTGGCPVGNLSQELGDTNPTLAARLARSIDGMAARLAAVLGEAQEENQLPPGSDPLSLAYFIIAAWHGALIRMKACKRIEPLDLFQRTVFDRLVAR